MSELKKVYRVCTTCQKAEKKMFRCTQCAITYYCSAQCQRQQWPVHKKQCAKMKQCEEYLRKEVNKENVNGLLQLYCFSYCKLRGCNNIDVVCAKAEEMMTFDIRFDACSLLPEYAQMDIYIITYLVHLVEEVAKCPIVYSKAEIQSKILLDKTGKVSSVITRTLGTSGVQLRYHYSRDTVDVLYLD